MIGGSETEACPTLLNSGEPNPRKRAMELVREGKKLDSFRGETGLKVLLANSSRPPIGRVERASGNAAVNLGLRAPASMRIFYDKRVNLDTDSAI